MAAVARTQLVEKTTCPHCWHVFPPEDVLWISAHAELLGDLRLGPEQPLRFRPSRFDRDGNALDLRGFACHQLACPRCHLAIPRAFLERQALFLSILGTPGCGKSFYLSAMTWELRRLLPEKLALSFTDVDPAANQGLHDYEELMFLNPRLKELQPLADLIPKTELQGDLYNVVLDGEQTLRYLRPFMFAIEQVASSGAAPWWRDAAQANGPGLPQASAERSRLLCLYDNAGEHFLAGQDSIGVPVTQHLARSHVLFFLFDPTQDPRFRKAVGITNSMPEAVRTTRQEMVLTEAAVRIRRYANLPQGHKDNRPLFVVVTKADAWDGAVEGRGRQEPWTESHGQWVFRTDKVERFSARVRDLLLKFCPELIQAAEGFFTNVTYVPVSALGQAPQRGGGNCPSWLEADSTRADGPAIRPADIRPLWVTVPFLMGLRQVTDLVPS